MIQISKKIQKCECDNCHKKGDKYRQIHKIRVGNVQFNLCTECAIILDKKLINVVKSDCNVKDVTDDDIKTEAQLRILFTKRINNNWNEDCEKELESLNENKMIGTNKLLYRNICDWDKK